MSYREPLTDPPAQLRRPVRITWYGRSPGGRLLVAALCLLGIVFSVVLVTFSLYVPEGFPWGHVILASPFVLPFLGLLWTTLGRRARIEIEATHRVRLTVESWPFRRKRSLELEQLDCAAVRGPVRRPKLFGVLAMPEERGTRVALRLRDGRELSALGSNDAEAYHYDIADRINEAIASARDES